MGSVGKKLGELRDSLTYVFLRFFRLNSFLGRTCFSMRKNVPGFGSTSSLWLSLFVSPSSLLYANVMYFAIQIHQK